MSDDRMPATWRDNQQRRGNTHGDEPPGGDNVEARVAQLEIHAGYIRRDLDNLKEEVRELRGDVKSGFTVTRDDMKTDFRVLFGSLIAVALGLAGIMAKGFGWL